MPRAVLAAAAKPALDCGGDMREDLRLVGLGFYSELAAQ